MLLIEGTPSTTMIESYDSISLRKHTLGENYQTVYWPDDLVLDFSKEKCLIIGYRINKHRMVVIDFLRGDEIDFFSFTSTNELTRNLVVLNCFNCKCKEFRHSKLIDWDFQNGKPIVSSNQTLIYFKPLSSWKLEYYSLNSISIDIFWNPSNCSNHEQFSNVSTNKYSQKLLYHFPDSPDRSQWNDMHDVLRILNLTNYIRYKINPKHNNSIFNNLQTWNFELMFTLSSYVYLYFIQKPCYILSSLLSYPIIGIKYNSTKSNRQKSLDNVSFSCVSLSYIMHQINLRLTQFYKLPSQFRKLKNSKTESQVLMIKYSKFSPSEYIKFYNTVWLIVNDILLGRIFYFVLMNNLRYLELLFEEYIPVYDQLLSNIVRWLMNSPAGFKLNNELASFLGQLIIWVLYIWRRLVLNSLTSNIGLLLKCIAIITKYGGISMFFCTVLDLVNILFLNIYGFYVACTRLYFWQLNIIMSLFKLFYGKKYNVLRNRVDFNDYEFDQLLLGIIVFSILIYLMPTVFIFYLTFAVARICLLIITSTLKFVLISLNHMPIVVLLLKLKNKERLPSGIIITLHPLKGELFLKTVPLSMKQILSSHIKSMLNFNLYNLNSDHNVTDSGSGAARIPELFSASDVIANWKRVSIITLAKNIITGDVIKDCDYKRMF